MRIRGRYVSTVGLGLLGLLVWFYDPQKIFSELGRMSPPWVWLAALCILAMGLLGVINAFLVVARDTHITLANFIPIYWTSWAVGLIVPGQIGDLASIGFLLRRQSLALSQIMGRAVLDKAISFAVMLGFALAGVLLVGQGVTTIGIWLSGFGLALVCVGVIAYFVSTRMAQTFDANRPGLLGGVTRTLIELVHTVQRAPLRVFTNVALTLVKVIVTGVAYWAMFRALGETDVVVLEVAALATAAGLVAYLPISINGVGTVEATGIFLFRQIDIDATVVISAYIVLRLLVLAIAWLPVFGWWAADVRKNDSVT